MSETPAESSISKGDNISSINTTSNGPNNNSTSTDTMGRNRRRQVKVVVVGDGAVGKTCLLNVFVKKDFPEEYNATIFENYTKDITVCGQVRREKVQKNGDLCESSIRLLIIQWTVKNIAHSPFSASSASCAPSLSLSLIIPCLSLEENRMNHPRQQHSSPSCC